MKIRPLLFIAILGVLIGIISAVIYNERANPLSPVAVSYNPYETGIYATGIIESFQVNGSDVSIYPEVAGRIIRIFVKNGDNIKKNTPILAIDDSVQRQVVARDEAQVRYAVASLVNVQKQLEKTRASYQLNPLSISRNALDMAIYAVKMAEENVKAAKAQYKSDKALLDKYIVRSTVDGTILRIQPALGDYASPSGSWDTYTQAMLPTVVMGQVTPYLQVRAFVDEILTPRLPDPDKLQATMFIRGMNNKSIPLEFSSIQPYTIPNIELSDERNERVDVRVLPIIFRLNKPDDIKVFPGQLVDVYLKGKA